MEQDTLHIIETTAKQLLLKIGLEGDVRVFKKEEGVFAIDITCQEPQL